MSELAPTAAATTRSQAQEAAPVKTDPPPDPVMTAYVGYLAGWFDIGRLAASRRLNRAGLQEPLLNDS